MVVTAPMAMALVVIACILAACIYLWIKLNLWRDFKWGIKLSRCVLDARLITLRGKTAADVWEDRVRKTPNNVAIVFEGKTHTFAQIDAAANQVANWAIATGLVRGDVVALLMENRPEFVCAWIGLCKVGVTSSLLNCNLRGKALLHTLHVCEARMLLFGAECEEAVATIASELSPIKFQMFSVGGDCSKAMLPHHVCTDASATWASLPTKSPSRGVRSGCSQNDVLFYIYTSGTTGLPKAAKIKHSRFLSGSKGFAIICDMSENDRIFSPLPIYHSAAGMVGVGMGWHVGCALILSRKFSASRFWDDLRKNGGTVIQYVGELCRYLVAQPPTSRDRDHQVRLCVGNGMRADVWREFVHRFRVGQICEFYGSTEGNVTLFNPFGVVGAVGYLPLPMRMPSWIPMPPLFRPFRIVKFDVRADEPVRNAKGRCIPCKPDEAGVVIGRIVQSNPAQAFEGYTSTEATQRKVLRDVFVKGDAYFMSGDILRMTPDGFFYFVDRVGDTFRWKGENVSTGEVAEICGNCPLLRQAEINVYGVTVPGADGRCGMACIVAAKLGPPELQALATHVMENLPSYAWPFFLRRSAEMQITGTFKQRKVDMVNEAFNPEVVTDPLYFLDTSTKTYVPMDTQLYNRIISGGVRL